MNNSSIIPAKPNKSTNNSFANLGQEKLINVNIKIPESLHYKLRVMASIKKTSIVTCVQEAVEKSLQDQAVKEAIAEFLPN